MRSMLTGIVELRAGVDDEEPFQERLRQWITSNGCGRRWGMPTLLRDYSFAQLLKENHDKLRVFGYVDEDQRRPYPKHPYPLMDEHRFSLDHELIVVTEEKREAMLLLPRTRTYRRRQVVNLEE
jgi:hypothetical protein